MERRHEVEQGENASFAQTIQDLIHTRDEQLTESADVVERSILNTDSNTARLFWTPTRGLEYGDVDCWIRPAARY